MDFISAGIVACKKNFYLGFSIHQINAGNTVRERARPAYRSHAQEEDDYGW